MNSPHKWPVTRKMFPCDDVMQINLQCPDDIDICAVISLGNHTGSPPLLFDQHYDHYRWLSVSILKLICVLPAIFRQRILQKWFIMPSHSISPFIWKSICRNIEWKCADNFNHFRMPWEKSILLPIPQSSYSSFLRFFFPLNAFFMKHGCYVFTGK